MEVFAAMKKANINDSDLLSKNRKITTKVNATLDPIIQSKFHKHYPQHIDKTSNK